MSDFEMEESLITNDIEEQNRMKNILKQNLNYVLNNIDTTQINLIVVVLKENKFITHSISNMKILDSLESSKIIMEANLANVKALSKELLKMKDDKNG